MAIVQPTGPRVRDASADRRKDGISMCPRC